MDGIYNKIIDQEVLKRLQDKFCAVAGIYAMCLDSEGGVLAQMSGEQADRDRLAAVVSEEQMYSLSRRVEESSLEEQAVEDTESDAVKYAAVCIKEQGRPVITWLVCAVLSDAASEEGRKFASEFLYQTTLSRFLLALDLLREVSGRIVGDKMSVEDALAKSRRSQDSREEMKAVLRRMEAATRVVQMFYSDAPTEEIAVEILGTVGGFLRIDSAYLCAVGREDSDTVDVVAEWRNEGVSSSFDQTKNQPRPPYLYSDKPLIISSSGRKKYRGDLKKAGITAFAAMPVTLEDHTRMYACFAVKESNHDWDLEEIKFINDAVKVLQSILTKRFPQMPEPQ